MRLSASSPIPYVLAVTALLLLAYSNHFHNGFHFDDSHAIQDNLYVRELKHIPRYFVDATTFSVLPQNQSYRPVLQTTFAIDYRLGGGYDPLAFQIDTFIWYVLLLIATAVLYLTITRNAWPWSSLPRSCSPRCSRPISRCSNATRGSRDRSRHRSSSRLPLDGGLGG